MEAINTLGDVIQGDSEDSRKKASQKLIHLPFIRAYALPETPDTQYSVPIHPSRRNGNCGRHFGR